MVDGVVLLVDASEGPLPQTRFVLRKALQAQAAGRARHQQGRPAGRPHRRGRRRDLRAVPRPRRQREDADRLPDRLLLGQGRPGLAGAPRGRRHAGRARTSSRCSRRSSTRSRRRRTTRARRCRRTSPTSTPRRTSAASRCAACTRARSARARRSPGAAPTASIERVKITELLMTEALDRVPAESAGPGDIIAIAGIPEITIGETLADPDDPAAAAGHHHRRAEHLDDDRHQHRAAGRRERQEAHRAAGEEPARHRARRQRLDPGAADRAPGHLGGAGPRRAAARDPRRDHAPRGLRAHRRQAAGRHPRDRRQAARADGAADDRRPVGLPGRPDPAAGAAQGPARADGRPRHRLDPDGVHRPGPRADRLPHRVPHRDPRHRPAAPRPRAVRAVARRAAHPADRLAGRRPPRAPRPASPWRTCRSAARCSSAPAPRSTRA